MHILWSAPFYLTYGIRFLLGWAWMLFMGLIVFIVGKHDQDPKVKIHKFRRVICELTIRIGCSIGLKLFWGITSLEEVKAQRLDLFKKYLGPEWAPKWQGASTIISN